MVVYVRVYDRNNILIKSWDTPDSGSTTGITYNLYDIPCNAYKIEYNIDGIIETKYTLGLMLNKHQYYYYNKNYIDVLYCTGTREETIEVEKEKITNAKKVNIVKMTIKHNVMQNTGYELSEKQLFDLASSPRIFQISGNTATNYILNDTSMQGFNTKTLGGRNTVLNLTREKVDVRYTSPENNFYN
jgi:hypothetical protein